VEEEEEEEEAEEEDDSGRKYSVVMSQKHTAVCVCCRI
jgi:hypothetical protein